jgi:DNA-binding NtrC family response regulator
VVYNTQIGVGSVPKRSAKNVTQFDILILEDEPFIALDLDYVFEDAGFKTRVCGSCADAIRWLSLHTPMAALIDIELKDGTCTGVASLLNERNVPFVVYSGSIRNDAPEIFKKGAWVPKPSDNSVVVNAVREAVDERDFGPLERHA